MGDDWDPEIFCVSIQQTKYNAANKNQIQTCNEGQSEMILYKKQNW